MSGKTIAYLRQLSAPREIEGSLPFRVFTWAAVIISMLSLSLQGVTSFSLILGALTLISVGFLVSWRRRGKRNLLIKSAIAVLTLVALIDFLRQAYFQLYDPRIPLAELFVWVQVLHSFDLPRRRDLMLSLVSSLILLSLAGSFAMTSSFAWLVILWLAAALPALYFAQLSRLRSLSAGSGASIPRLPSWKKLGLVFMTLLACVSLTGLAIGAAMPRVSATYMRSLPFSLRRSFSPSEGFEFYNPGYPHLPMRPPPDALESNPEAYFGFSPFLDLRTRGSLVEMTVMKVRSTEPAYWRGMSFMEYNGYSWTTPEDQEPLHTRTQPFLIDYSCEESHCCDRRIIQTYYIERDQANVIFAAWRPCQVYFPYDYIYRDSSGLKSPNALVEGLVYSVISDGVADEGRAASVTEEADAEVFGSYLEVPHLPERVRDLAARIAPDGTGPYARALALRDYLAEEYRYSLDVPALDPGQDAVDQFLFEHRRGYCEHFASAYVILCRLSGIPARVVTGYSTGSYNPFTGLYEVSLSDAHAWAEIYVGGVGWLAVEPTPGFVLPDPGAQSGSLWIMGDFFSWVGGRLASLFPASLRSGLKSALSCLASGASSLASSLAYSVRQAPWLPLLFTLVLLVLPLVLLLRRRSRGVFGGPGAVSHEGPLQSMRGFLEALGSLGFVMEPAQTAREFIGGLSLSFPDLDLSEELGLFDRARYGRQPLAEEEEVRLERGLSAALQEIRRRKRKRIGKR